jgi:hypothetical protein
MTNTWTQERHEAARERARIWPKYDSDREAFLAVDLWDALDEINRLLKKGFCQEDEIDRLRADLAEARAERGQTMGSEDSR